NRSQLIYHAECGDQFAELWSLTLGNSFEAEAGGMMSPSHLLIDSGGNRTQDVYDFAATDIRIIPCKGQGRQANPLTETRLHNGVLLRNFNPNYYKDAVYRLVHDDDPTKWLPHCDVTDSYCNEMAAEH